jgi:predicted adenylyl cyclase CyaB
MHTEFEVKFLGIDPVKLEEKIVEEGGLLEQWETLLRRVVFAGVTSNEFVRVRDEWSKITMTYKNVQSNTIDGVRELNITINSFEDGVSLLEHAGLIKNAYQESYRTIYMLDECEICIDRWPGISLYCEIEWPTQELVEWVAQKLWLNLGTAFGGPVNAIYEQELWFVSWELETIKELSFANPPMKK